jgi:hypothetical protein
MPSSTNGGFGELEYMQGLRFEEWSPTHFSIKTAPEQRINERTMEIYAYYHDPLARLDY